MDDLPNKITEALKLEDILLIGEELGLCSIYIHNHLIILITPSLIEAICSYCDALKAVMTYSDLKKDNTRYRYL